MAVEYTHNFIFQFDGQTMEGELEFNVDGKASYKTDNPIQNLELTQSMALSSLLMQFKSIFDQFGDIIKIKVEKK